MPNPGARWGGCCFVIARGDSVQVILKESPRLNPGIGPDLKVPGGDRAISPHNLIPKLAQGILRADVQVDFRRLQAVVAEQLFERGGAHACPRAADGECMAQAPNAASWPRRKFSLCWPRKKRRRIRLE